MLKPDPVSIEVDGERLDTWTDYELDSDLLTPADGFRLTLAIGGQHDAEGRRRAQRAYTRIRDTCPTNARVRVYIGGGDGGGAPRSLQLSGILDERRTAADRNGGSRIEIEGRDVAAFLTDSAVPYGLKISDETLFLDMVRAVVRPWALEVTADSIEGRLLTTGISQRESRERLARRRATDRGIAMRLYTREGQALGQGVSPEGETQLPLVLGQVPDGAQVDTVETVLARADPAELARLRAARAKANGYAPIEVERIKVRDAKPRAGETCWQLLERHARRLGMMLWADPAGRIVVSSPSLKAHSRMRIVRRFEDDSTDRNNVIAGGCASSGAERYSEVRAYGRSRGNDAERSPIHATVRDDGMPFPRIRVVSDGSLRSADEADRRARRESRIGRMRSRVFDYTVPGHSQGGVLWSTDTLVRVVDDVEGIDADLYVTRRTFAHSEGTGTVTRLRLVFPNDFEL